MGQNNTTPSNEILLQSVNGTLRTKNSAAI